MLKPITPNTLTDHDALIKDLRATAERGYATDNEANFVGVVRYGFSLRFTTPVIFFAVPQWDRWPPGPA
ncbi:IclR family transcriptional regulator C-terminal domain-containing protein [Streptomyces bobili]|uniref:IclR family transcriptional regulator domain-containing protein n=1 Tax=Streptomyces bobili TaxID=67280 RepID=UPI0036F8F4BB